MSGRLHIAKLHVLDVSSLGGKDGLGIRLKLEKSDTGGDVGGDKVNDKRGDGYISLVGTVTSTIM